MAEKAFQSLYWVGRLLLFVQASVFKILELDQLKSYFLSIYELFELNIPHGIREGFLRQIKSYVLFTRNLLK